MASEDVFVAVVIISSRLNPSTADIPARPSCVVLLLMQWHDDANKP